MRKELGVPVLEQPCAAFSRVYSAADCFVSEHICSMAACVAPVRVPLQQLVLSLDESSLEVSGLQQL
jgi:hypothetical protein